MGQDVPPLSCLSPLWKEANTSYHMWTLNQIVGAALKTRQQVLEFCQHLTVCLAVKQSLKASDHGHDMLSTGEDLSFCRLQGAHAKCVVMPGKAQLRQHLLLWHWIAILFTFLHILLLKFGLLYNAHLKNMYISLVCTCTHNWTLKHTFLIVGHFLFF